MRDGEEPRVGGVGPDRAGRRDKDGAAGDRGQHRERGPAAPADAELVRGEPDRGAHAVTVTRVMAANVGHPPAGHQRADARVPVCYHHSVPVWLAHWRSNPPYGKTWTVETGHAIDVFLADDNLIVREGVRALIER